MNKPILFSAVIISMLLGTQASATPEFLAPWTCGDTYVVTQIPGYDYSHNDIWNQYAWDIAMPVGTPILAPAPGVISYLKNDSTGGGCSQAYAEQANYVDICFDDGTAMMFVHLSSVTVKKGDYVNTGDLIGYSGQTGYSCGAHLHFSAMQSCNAYITYSSPSTWAMGNPGINQKVTSDNCGQHTPSSDDNVLVQSMTYDPQNTDINGDGKADICARSKDGLECALSNGNGFDEPKLLINVLPDSYGWNVPLYSNSLRFADLNGDSKADVCVRTDYGIECWLSDGTGYSTQTERLDALSNNNGYEAVKYVSGIRFADINGDGKDDVCARMKDKFSCFLSTGNGFGTEVSINDLADKDDWYYLQYASTIRMADVDGDGKADMCIRGKDTVYCWFSNGDSWSDKVAMQSGDNAMSDDKGWNEEQYFSTIRFADINGDGKADLCARDSQSIICQLSQGRSPFGKTVRGPSWSDDFSTYDYNNYSTTMYGDLNGDGKDDVCQRTDKNLACALSNGNGFDKEYKIDFFSDANAQDTADHFRTLRMGDMNADGKMEICGRADDGIKCFVFTDTGFQEITGSTPNWSDAKNWNKAAYYPTIRFGGIKKKECIPSEEVCDRIDNDCDGEIDEGDVCNTPETCTPSEEVCDGKDNDCDGKIDEDNVCGVPETCTPSEEICDGKDNDCDGKIDEDNVCVVPDSCTPSEEICDGKDNDCDGKVDEGDVCNSKPGDECTPSKEICDGKDNDCDGKIDEGDVCDSEAGGTVHSSSVEGCSIGNRSQAPSGLLALFGILSGLGLMLVRRKREN